MPPQWKACWHASLPEIQWLTHVVLKEPRVPECASLHIMICGGRVRDPIQKSSIIRYKTIFDRTHRKWLGSTTKPIFSRSICTIPKQDVF